MPLPLADILRTREANAPLHGVEPPGTDALVSEGEAPPEPQAPPSSGDAMQQGAAMRLGAAQEAAQGVKGYQSALQDQESQRKATEGPLQDQLKTSLSQPMPEPPAAPNLPAPPDLRLRPFLESDGASPWQAIQNAVNGISLLAQMGFGAASGVPELSLRAMKGALEGWQEGDMTRGDREFAAWQASVKQIQQDYENQRKRVEDVTRQHQGNVEQQRLALMLAMAESGASQEYLKALFNSDQAFYQLMDKQGAIVEDLGKTQEQLGIAHQKATALEQKVLADAQKWRAEMEQRERLHAEDVAVKRDRLALDSQKAAEAGSKADKDVTAAAADRMVAIQNATTAVDTINALRSNPKTRAEIESYLGPLAAQKRLKQYVPGQMAGQIPDSVVKFDQAVNLLKNNALKAQSGSQVTIYEEKRFDKTFPLVEQPPDMFWTRYDAMARDTMQGANTFMAAAASHKPTSLVMPANPQSGGAPKPDQQAQSIRVRRLSDGKSGNLTLKPGEAIPAGYEVIK